MNNVQVENALKVWVSDANLQPRCIAIIEDTFTESEIHEMLHSTGEFLITAGDVVLS